MPNNPQKTLRIAVLASGAGHTLQALLDACADGRLSAAVVKVVSNNPQSGALQRAAQQQIAHACLNATTHPDSAQLDQAMCQCLQAASPDVVVLAGYMKKLGPQVLSAFKGRMINTHPALLPKFGGQGMYDLHVHAAVLAAGETESGATVHFVEGEYDTGRLIAQARVPVLPNDDVAALAERVKALERVLLVKVLQARATSGNFVLIGSI